MSMHQDLKWLAENVSEWPSEPKAKSHSIGWNGSDDGREPDFIRRCDPFSDEYTKAQWLQARQELGLNNTETPEEKEELDRIEAGQVAKRRSAPDFLRQAAELMAEMAELIDKMADIFESELELPYEVECRVMNTKYYTYKERNNEQ